MDIFVITSISMFCFYTNILVNILEKEVVFLEL